MMDMLKVIFGAIVVGDFLLAIGFFAVWKNGRMRVPPPSPDAPETKNDN